MPYNWWINSKRAVARRLSLLRRFGKWLLIEPWPVALGIFLPAALTFIAFNQSLVGTEIAVRWTGMILQLAGFVAVLYAVDGRWRMKYLTGARGAFGHWWSRRPRRSSYSNAVGLGVGASMSISGGRARGSIRAGKDAPVEKRIEVLERNVDSLEAEVGRALDLIEKAKKETLDTIKAGQRDIDGKIGELSTKVEQAVVGGLTVELMGVLFFLWGIVLATGSPELAG
jgi:hypothetical protein